ncbi:MAG TPA: SufE family protein, partial [Ardenticatenaceae bacterium]|nr:SufE family protein [Ardenticatenaceae bacterium]
ERLELLLDYAGRLPDLPEDLKEARAQMEPVPECQAPVYLFSRFEDGKVYYNIDVPDEAPTVRGFAGILYEGLNGLPPHSVQTTPDDLYEQMGLDKVLSPQRLRGLTALLMRMKRRARDVAA